MFLLACSRTPAATMMATSNPPLPSSVPMSVSDRTRDDPSTMFGSATAAAASHDSGLFLADLLKGHLAPLVTPQASLWRRLIGCEAACGGNVRLCSASSIGVRLTLLSLTCHCLGRPAPDQPYQSRHSPHRSQRFLHHRSACPTLVSRGGQLRVGEASQPTYH